MKKTAKERIASKHSRNNFYMHVVKTRAHEVKTKAWNFEAKYKARILEAEDKAKDLISCLEDPWDQGLSSRTTSLNEVQVS